MDGGVGVHHFTETEVMRHQLSGSSLACSTRRSGIGVVRRRNQVRGDGSNLQVFNRELHGEAMDFLVSRGSTGPHKIRAIIERFRDPHRFNRGVKTNAISHGDDLVFPITLVAVYRVYGPKFLCQFQPISVQVDHDYVGDIVEACCQNHREHNGADSNDRRHATRRNPAVALADFQTRRKECPTALSRLFCQGRTPSSRDFHPVQ